MGRRNHSEHVIPQVKAKLQHSVWPSSWSRWQPAVSRAGRGGITSSRIAPDLGSLACSSSGTEITWGRRVCSGTIMSPYKGHKSLRQGVTLTRAWEVACGRESRNQNSHLLFSSKAVRGPQSACRHEFTKYHPHKPIFVRWRLVLVTPSGKLEAVRGCPGSHREGCKKGRQNQEEKAIHQRKLRGKGALRTNVPCVLMLFWCLDTAPRWVPPKCCLLVV